MRSSAQTGAPGFTLVEILVVLAIMALLLGLLPRLSVGLEHARLRGAADEAAALLERAHVASMASGTTIAITVDPGSRVLSSPLSGLRLERTVQKLVLLRNTQFDGADGEFRFYPDGSADGGAIRLFSAHSEEQVTIDWVTGHVARSR